MKTLDIHADDYALSVHTSQDILRCIREDRLDSVSILPNMSCFDRCLSLWREELSTRRRRMPAVSIHLNFVEGRCLTAERPKGLSVADRPSGLSAPDRPSGLSAPDLLSDDDGYFKTSWKNLFFLSFSPRRKRVKQQLKAEIRAQIEKTRTAFDLGPALRIDSHQHTHVIPVVFDALSEVIRENHYEVEYIRDCRDFLLPYLRQRKLLFTYRPINMIKVLILKLLSLRARLALKKIPSVQRNRMNLCGIFLSGRMDRNRVEHIFPSLYRTSVKHGRSLEVLFHPGALQKEEVNNDFPDANAVTFYLSENRKTEYRAVMTNRLKEKINVGR